MVELAHRVHYICQRSPGYGVHSPVESTDSEEERQEERQYEQGLGAHMQFLRTMDCWAASLAMVLGYAGGTIQSDSDSIEQVQSAYRASPERQGVSTTLPDPGEGGFNLDALPSLAATFHLRVVSVRPNESLSDLLEKFYQALRGPKAAVLIMQMASGTNQTGPRHAIVLRRLTTSRTGTDPAHPFNLADVQGASVSLLDPWPLEVPGALGCRLVGSGTGGSVTRHDLDSSQVEIRGSVRENGYEGSFVSLPVRYEQVLAILQAPPGAASVAVTPGGMITHRDAALA